MVGIPRPKKRPWYVKETLGSIGGVIVAFGAGVAAIVREARNEHPSGWLIVALAAGLVAGLWVAGLKIAQSLHKDASDDKISSPDDLRGCLHVIHGAVAGLKKLSGTPPLEWLRITLHRVDGDKLEQTVDYVGSEQKGAGREFSIRSGVIGRVARSGEPRTFDRAASQTFEEWASYLVDVLAMTRPQAESTRKDRYAFFGVPIKSPGGKEVRAVVYLDATEPGFFDQETTSLVVDGCAGLAAWIDEQYYRSG